MSSTSAMLAPVLFGFALFLGSGLLFIIQPMIGRSMVAHLGGHPVTWNACLVFFQASLLAGFVGLVLLFGLVMGLIEMILAMSGGSTKTKASVEA